MEDLIKELGLKIDNMKSSSVTKEELTALKADFDALKEKAKEFEGMTAKLDDLAAQILTMKESAKPVMKTMAEELKENKDSIKAIAKGGQGEVTLKANTTRASIATNPHEILVPGIGQLQRVSRSLYDYFAKIPVSTGNHNGTIAYIDWDEATTVKAAAAIAEGAAFQESTAKFKGYTLQLQKIGDTLPVTEEFFEDEQMAAAELGIFLQANVESVIDTQIVTGDNTGSNLKGLVSSTPAYVPVNSGIVDANIYDLIIKVKESITSVGGAKYIPNFVAMNIADINKLKLKKDKNNNYTFPYSDPRLDSLNIVEDNHVPPNTMYVGDGRFGRIYEMGGVTLSQGYVGTQFTQDMLTLKARKRLAFLIRTADATGFRKVTDIAAALVTLATP